MKIWLSGILLAGLALAAAFVYFREAPKMVTKEPPKVAAQEVFSAATKETTNVAAKEVSNVSTAEAPKKPATLINPPPTPQDWTDIGRLPDWSGVWNPKITDQDAQIKTNPPPWNEQAAKKIEQMFAEEKAGRPVLIFPDCLPEAHPSWMLITHNAMEILFTPGRVTMLGESDGNRLRRIYSEDRKSVV